MKPTSPPKRIERLQEQVSKKFDAKTKPTREEGSRIMTQLNKLKAEQKNARK